MFRYFTINCQVTVEYKYRIIHHSCFVGYPVKVTLSRLPCFRVNLNLPHPRIIITTTRNYETMASTNLIPRISKRKRAPKIPGAQNTRRSAPARFDPPFVLPETPASLFLPLTVELFPGDHPLGAADPTPSPTALYSEAITRLETLVAESIITAMHKRLLEAAMTTAQSFVTSGEPHTLLQTIASPSTPASEVLTIIAVITAGMRAFIAQPGPSPGTSVLSVSSSTRSDFVKASCGTRDARTCLVTGRRTGACCHIIPYSVKGDKAENFWAFVAMFKGAAETERLKIMTLGPRPSSTDTIRNVLWLSPEAHLCFDNGQMAIVPVITGDSFDTATATDVSVFVIFQKR